MKRLLLLSNSTGFGGGYLDHAEEAIREHFAGVGCIAFVPYALKDQERYTAAARDRFAMLNVRVERVTADAAGRDLLARAEGVFVGGGNTFRLLDLLQRSGVLGVLRERALSGMPYLGSSAGANVACPTIRTTNDMPIVQPASFDALGLVPFQINPHYVDADPASRHMGETRETRLSEYLEENELPVVGLREGTWLQVAGDEITLHGAAGARLFRRDEDPEELHEGDALGPLLGAEVRS